MTYVMTASSDITLLIPIINTALIDDNLGNLHARTATALVNGFGVFLPVTMK